MWGKPLLNITLPKKNIKKEETLMFNFYQKYCGEVLSGGQAKHGKPPLKASTRIFTYNRSEAIIIQMQNIRSKKS